MTKDFLEALATDVGEDPVLVAGAPKKEQITEVEEYANFILTEDYAHFLERFGAVIAGPYSIYGLGASEAMGSNERSVIEVTERFRRDKWPGVDNSLVISMDHAGNAITLNAQGEVHRFDHDAVETTMIASAFGDFVKLCLIGSV